MSNPIISPTFDPVSPEALEAGLRQAHREHSDAFWAVFRSVLQKLSHRSDAQSGDADPDAFKRLPVPY